MKRYKLLKDLPFAKAGDIFKGELEYGTTVLFPEDYENYKHKLSSDEFWDFDEWFEEIKEPEQNYCVDNLGGCVSKIDKNYLAIFPTLIANLKSIGNCFETEEEAKKYLEYLKAKEIIKQDTKGFKPNWDSEQQEKWGLSYECDTYFCRTDDKPVFNSTRKIKYTTIYFRTKQDIEESFKKHPEEWKTYLTYDQ